MLNHVKQRISDVNCTIVSFYLVRKLLEGSAFEFSYMKYLLLFVLLNVLPLWVLLWRNYVIG